MTKFKDFFVSENSNITEGFFSDVGTTVKVLNKIKEFQNDAAKEFADIAELNGDKEETVKLMQTWSETNLRKVGRIIKQSDLSDAMKEASFAGFVSGVFKTMSAKFSDLTGEQITDMLGWDKDIANVAFADGAVRNISQSKAIAKYIGKLF